jgi:hypothetical protein
MKCLWPPASTHCTRWVLPAWRRAAEYEQPRVNACFAFYGQKSRHQETPKIIMVQVETSGMALAIEGMTKPLLETRERLSGNVMVKFGRGNPTVFPLLCEKPLPKNRKRAASAITAFPPPVTIPFPPLGPEKMVMPILPMLKYGPSGVPSVLAKYTL